nr:SpaA isopeptide-forming pilin-related protein [uncultured Oscillibacter sp.]
MKKRLISLLLILLSVFALLPTAAFAADSEEAALGEVGIYNGGYELSYLSINGTVRTQIYTYFEYTDANGTLKEVPAYCVNPNTVGVPQTVAKGESIQYIANERSSDPKVVGIISNGYPHRSLGELKLDNKYQAYYATKMALWCYLLPNWNINNLKVAPGLTGLELERGQKILAAAKDIYKWGTTYNYMLSPKMTATPDKSVAYPVTINGVEYKQQVFTLWSETWVYDYDISVAFSNPSEVPAGTRLVDENNNDITKVSAEWTGDGYGAKFKVLYPADSIEGQSGTVQLSFEANVAQYAAMYAVCAEKDKYGNLQNYICDLDNYRHMELAAVSSYNDPAGGGDDPDETALKIVKLEEGTEIPLEGAVFSVYDPEGRKVGSFSTLVDGTVTIPLTLEGHYTVTEEIPPLYHLLPDVRTQHADVEYDKTATLTFWNAPYGSIRVQKLSNTGETLNGVTVQIKNITTGEVQTAQTKIGGVAVFDELEPGGYEVQELAGISGWIADTDTVQTVSVVAGKCSDATIINKELPGLRITKYERGTMTLMPNVSFEIFRDAESLGIFRTDEFGQILLTDCQPGTYLAQEVNTGSDGHVLDTTPQEVELHAGDGIKNLVFFNDRLPGIHLIKVDSSDLSQPIANARFRFEAVDGSYGPVELTTLEDGTIDLSKLPVASYVVTELECPGYVVDDAQRIIHLDGGEQAQFVFTNSKLPSLYLYKESADGTPLGGVTYRLAKIEDGSRYLDRTTSSTGEIVWEGLDPGVYSLQEQSTVSDHLLDTTEYHVELFAGRDSTICLQNDKRPNLTIYKYDADNHSIPVPNTTFLVEAADGHSVAEVTTGPDGSATVPNLWPGVFKISETSVGSSEYLMDAPDQYVTLYPNRDREAYFYDHKAPVIEIIKENSITHDRLANVRFQVWYASNDTETGEYNDLGIFTTDENGRIELTGPANGLRDGWFRAKELAPPTGFAIKDSDTQEAFIQAGKGHTFLFENTPLSAICVWKYDSKTGAALSDCWFQIRYLSGNTSGSGGTVIGTYRTSSNGSFTVTNCEAGTYIIEELSSDGSHVIDTPPQTVYLSGQEQEVIQVHFGNSPKGAVLVKKVSASDNTLLSDVEFFVTTADGAVVGDANGKFVTDSAGSFLVENVDPGTTLVIKETRAKSGYLLDDTPQTVQVKAGQTVTVEFRNQPLGNLVIEKWGRTGTTTVPLEGVKFEIKYANGQYVDAGGGTLSSNGIYYTNASGQIILSGITGTVVATELESVEGYAIDPDSQSQTVTINPNDTQTLRFYNNAVGGVEIIKVSEADKTKRLSGVTFEIRRVSDDALVDTVTTGTNGSVFVTLEDDSYYAVETESAEGFKLDSTPHYFTVKDGKCPPLTVTNAPISGILIHKISSVDGKGISGVPFILYDSGHNPIDQQTSDDRGYVYFENLTVAGRYYLRELENEGYIPDTELKTVYVKAGETTEITWKNTPITAQIQIVKKSADYNPTTGLPAGTLLEGAVFEIYDKAGNVVDTIRSDSRGLAVSKPLPLSRYTIREIKAPERYGVNETELTAYLEHEGQIVRFEVTNNSLTTGVSITKTGPKEIVAGQPVRYVFSGIANTSNVRLDSFYFRDTLPAQVRLETVVTGTWNFPGVYKIVYRVNGGDYRALADNLSTSKNYTLAASSAALGLASNERVTEVMFVFGQAPAGFAQVETPYLYCKAVAGLPAGSFVNVADVGGVYNGTWVQAVSRWVTSVYGKTPTLPRTGY